ISGIRIIVRMMTSSVGPDWRNTMFRSIRLQTCMVLAAGALLGYLAAAGKLPLGRQANAATGNELPAAVASQATSLVPGQAGEEKKVIVFTVRLPANASLQIDGDKTKETGEVRTFQTPPLPVTGHYAYTLKASYQGKEVTRTIQLRRGGDNTFDLRAEFQRPD